MRIVVAFVLLGCGNEYDPPPRVSTPKPIEDGGPGYVCGVIPGSPCAEDGKELARCLCGTFEQQMGQLVCCRDGRAQQTSCAKAEYAVDCRGRPLIAPADAATD